MADRGRVGSLVVGCRSAANKEWRRAHEGHQNRVKSVRPATDMAAPSTIGLTHLRTNLKRERLLEDRYMEIDRENQVLLKKMSEAMKKPNPYTTMDPAKKPPGASRTGRKMELIRITQENQRMLKAIANTRPVYDTKKWEDSYRKSEVILKNCCNYPVITRLPRVSSSPSVLMSITSDPPEGGASPSAASPAAGRGGDDRNFVLKEGMRIGDQYYLLEFSTDGRSLNISAYNSETQTTLELVVKEKKHRQLYRELNGDYSLIAARLHVDGDRLTLD